MGQNPVHPVNIPIPTKIGSKIGGAPKTPPKMGSQNGFDNHGHRSHDVHLDFTPPLVLAGRTAQLAGKPPPPRPGSLAKNTAGANGSLAQHPVMWMAQRIQWNAPSFPVTWHLQDLKDHLSLLQGPLVRCHVSGSQGTQTFYLSLQRSKPKTDSSP